ncbi:hypothetical protein A7D23_12870 [Dehalobacter sp. TeCB1]|jgi:hypothetical protein|uniref:Uncharacterized protein n=2 Tax=Dehalobacter restrictus TaxID=55583 RepID=A0ABM5P9F9_DEHRP|nr:hypothetical protein [Dehalobacter restrictus]AHF11253.1 hypothetical protein DEHRE_03220 [Dehalobacter restrictus DSM 9455]OCZ51410.1 hypothetical protein A7D23_12870 [Dehalobacter sp. TeCB1]
MDIIQSISMIQKRKIFTSVAVGLGVLSLAVLLFVNVNRAYSDSVNSQEESAFENLAVETLKIDTNKAKPVYMREIYDDNVSELNSDLRNKCQDALKSLTKDGTHKIGDFMPVFFIEGNDKVSIAIKHDDGTLTLDEFDISKHDPIKLNHIAREVK